MQRSCTEEKPPLLLDPSDRLLVVLDEKTCLAEGHDPADLGISLVKSGVCRLWYRCRAPQESSRKKQIARLLKFSTPGQLKLTVSANDDHFTPQAGCGRHLSSHRTPIKEFNGVQGNDLTGQSCHSLEEALNAFKAGVDYITISPIWNTTSVKTHPRTPLGTPGLAQVTQNTPGPVFALGGITSERVLDCLLAGAHGVAVLGAICQATDPLKAAESLLYALELALKTETQNARNSLALHQ